MDKGTIVVLIYTAFLLGMFARALPLENAMSPQTSTSPEESFEGYSYIDIIAPVKTSLLSTEETLEILEFNTSCHRTDEYRGTDKGVARIERYVYFYLSIKNISNQTVNIKEYQQSWTLQGPNGTILLNYLLPRNTATSGLMPLKLEPGQEKTLENWGTNSVKLLSKEQLEYYNNVNLLICVLELSDFVFN